MNWIWYSNNFFARILSFFLWPVSLFYRFIINIRRLLYISGLKKVHAIPVPVIVVGNLTVGGAGKTPLVIYIAKELQKKGYQPGIISRGYKSTVKQYPYVVLPESDPILAGDEPVLIARHTQCPVVIAPDRVAAANYLLNNFYCNVIISDDGLQHYALGRNIEIVVVDGERRFGNGLCLPAGPLREPKRRANDVDFVVCNTSVTAASPLPAGEVGTQRRVRGIQENFLQEEFVMTLEPGLFINLPQPELRKNADYFLDRKLYAIAGIGNPKRFFTTLKTLGLYPMEHRFPDHHIFTSKEITVSASTQVLMTEKDAIKCMKFAAANCWYLPVEADVEADFMLQLEERLTASVRD